MNIFTKVSIFALSVISFSCARATLYMPQTSSPVLVEDAGDIQAGVGVALMGLSPIEAHTSIAVAPTDNFAVYGSYSKYRKGGWITDVKIGYSRDINDKYRVGLFVGMSSGSARSEADNCLYCKDYLLFDGTTELKYIMPQFRIRSTNNFYYIFSSKIV